METDLYIFKKEIDWSALHLGINIPISLQNIFYDNIKLKMSKGDSKSKIYTYPNGYIEKLCLNLHL